MDALAVTGSAGGDGAVREYLTFAAAWQEYGISILSVREIRG